MWKRWLLVFTGVTHATILHTGQHESPSSSRTVPQEHEISYYTQPNRWHTQLLHRGEKYMWVCVSCKGRQYYNDKRNKIRILPACLFPSVMSACVLWLQKKFFPHFTTSRTWSDMVPQQWSEFVMSLMTKHGLRKMALQWWLVQKHTPLIWIFTHSMIKYSTPDSTCLDSLLGLAIWWWSPATQ